MKVTARSGKWFIGETTQPNYYTASTINAQTTEATIISTATMNVSSLSLLTDAVTPFTPRSIPGCVLWLDGKDVNGTGSNITAGTAMTSWTDKSGNGNSTTSKVGTITMTANAIGNNAAPYFPNNPSYFLGSLPTYTGTAIYHFAVATLTTSSTAYGRILGLARTGTNDYGDSTTEFAFIRNNATQAFIIGRNSSYLSTAIPAYSTPFIIQSSQNGSTQSIGVNGTLTPATQNTGISSGFNINAYGIGVNPNTGDAGSYYDGVIAEVVVYMGTVLTTAQIQSMEGYLAQKWGLTSLLPLTHPGRTTQYFKALNYVAPSTQSFYVSSSLAYWGPYLLNSGFRTAQPQVFFLKPPFNLVSSGLLARYSMNESSGSTVIDSIAGNNITIGGSPSRVSTSYGSYTGYALSIQNATQYGYITLPANMVVGAHSITSWVYFTGFASGRSSTWVGWGGGSGCKGENHAFYNNNASVTIIFGGPSCIYSLNFLDNNTATVSPQLNTWYFCVTTWDGSNTWKTYCYSPTTAYAFTFSYGMNAVSAGGVFAIGISNNLDSQFAGTGYGGYIGEVRFYNRVLTASEVSQIYSGTG